MTLVTVKGNEVDHIIMHGRVFMWDVAFGFVSTGKVNWHFNSMYKRRW